MAAHRLSPLSRNQAENLFTEINTLLEAEFKDEAPSNIGMQNTDILPTTESFDKADVLKCLRILEPNSIIFFQDLQKMLQMYLSQNTPHFGSEDVEYLKEKYLICDQNNLLTLRRIAAVFPSLTCNLLKFNGHIARPIPLHYLSDSENYPRQMTTRCVFSLIPLTPMIGKLRLIEAALLYQLLEQAKFNTIKMENGQVNYAEHMKIAIDYCSADYMSEFESNEKRLKQFDELELYKCGYPIAPVFDAADKLEEIVGKVWENTITVKFSLQGIDFD